MPARDAEQTISDAAHGRAVGLSGLALAILTTTVRNLPAGLRVERGLAGVVSALLGVGGGIVPRCRPCAIG